jgi:hypothetical protein
MCKLKGACCCRNCVPALRDEGRRVGVCMARGGDICVRAEDTAASVFRRAQPRFAIASNSLDYSVELTKSLLGSSLN